MGKSKIILDTLQSISPKNVLITVPYNEIKEVWDSEIEKWGGHNHQYTIINQRYMSDELLNNADIIVIDEVHTLSSRQKEQLSKVKEKLIGISGSLNDFTIRELWYDLKLPVIYRFSLLNGINSGIISNFEVKVISCELTPIERINYNKLTTDFEKAKEEAYNNPSRETWKMICAGRRANFLYQAKSKINLAKKIIDHEERALIFTTRISVAKKFAPVYSSKGGDENFMHFVEGKIPKLAVAQKLAMGVTINNLKVGIFHQIQSNDESAVQRILRMCNLEDERIATIYICMYSNTVDEDWVKKALNLIPKSKITFTDEKRASEFIGN